MWHSGLSHWHPTWVICPQVLILLTQNRVLSLLSNCLCPSVQVSSPTAFLCIPSHLGPLLSFTQTRQDRTSTSSQCSPSYTIPSSKRVQNPFEALVYPVLIPLPSSYCFHCAHQWIHPIPCLSLPIRMQILWGHGCVSSIPVLPQCLTIFTV